MKNAVATTIYRDYNIYINMAKESRYPKEVESTAKDAMHVLDSDRQEYLTFINEIDRRESWSKIHNPAHDLPRGAVIRDLDDKKTILISLSSRQPVVLKDGKMKYVFLSPFELYMNPPGTFEWDEVLVELPADRPEIISKGYEILEPRIDDIKNLRGYIKSGETLSKPVLREELPKKKTKTVKKASPAKKKENVDVDLDALLPDIEVEDVAEVKKTPERRKKIKETVDSIAKKKEVIREEAVKIEGALKREAEDRALKEIAEISEKLRDISAREIHDMGYTVAESMEKVKILQQDIDRLATNVHNKTMNLNAALKVLTLEIIKRKIQKPVKKEETKKQTKSKEMPFGQYSDPKHLLEMACLWIMGRYNQSTTRSYKLCEERMGDINRLSKKMRDGKMTLMEAVKELESSILENAQLTTIVTEYKEPTGEEVKEKILFAEEKRRKMAGKVKESAVIDSLMGAPLSKDIETTLGYSAKREIQDRASERVKQMLKTSTKEIYVHLKGQSAIILEFQCYQATGMGPKGDTKACYQNYISKIISDYGITVVNAPNGWHAHFSARTLPDGNIQMSQGEKDFDNFFGMVDDMKKNYDEPGYVLIYVNSFIDKSEYGRIN